MYFLIYFLLSFIFSEFIFLFSNNFDPKLLIDDVSRFLGIENVIFASSYISIFVALINLVLLKIFNRYQDLIIKKLYKFTFYFSINLVTVLSVFYFLRVYTVSRVYMILSILLFPLILLIIFENFEKSKSLNSILILILAFSCIFIAIENYNIDEGELASEVLESDSSKNNKPSDYYPDLEMNLIGAETDIYNFVPTIDSILLNYENFKSEIRTKLTFENKYQLDVYSICCYWLEYQRSGGKSVGYLESYGDNLIYVHGSGFISYVKKNDLILGNFKFNLIESNFRDVVNNKFLYQRDEDFEYGWSDWWESTRDVIIINDKIYVSFVNEKSKDCVNVEILSAEFNYQYLDFDYFFTNDDCVMRTDFPYYNGMVAGGKLVNYENTHIYLSTGDFRDWTKAQDDNSYLGKVISINLNNGQYKVISKGHRNPQGLAITKNSNFLIETEHGPVGGDEINLIEIDKSQNFGWPISSYGKHWYPEDYEYLNGIATLHSSHEDYGMREPLFYQYVGFFGGIGISDVEINHFKNNDSFFVTTLYGRQIFEIDVNILENKMETFTRYKVTERIRDIEYDPENDVYFLILEDGPSIGILSEINQ